MKSIIPYDSKSWEIEGVISIASTRFSKYIAFITEDTLLLYNSRLINFPKVSEFKRSNESITEYGQNHWIQWIKDDLISYGNCAGVIFISTISPKGEISEPLIVNIKQIITTTFTIGKLLGVCTSHQNIFIINQDGKILHVLKLNNGAGGIKNARFYEPSTLIAVADGKVTQYDLSPQVLKGEEPVAFTQIGEKGAISASLNFIPYLLNIVYQDGSVSVQSMKGVKRAVNVVNESSTEIVISEWLLDGLFLFIVNREGKGTIWNSATCSIHYIQIPNIGNCTSYCFDNTSQQLFYVADKKAYSIDFIQFYSHIGSTPRKIINIENNTVIADLEKNSTLSSLFPIHDVITKDNRFFIYNHFGYVVTDNNMNIIKNPVIIDIITAVAIENMFAVITKNDDLGYVVVFIDMDVNEIGFVKLTHAPLSVHSCGSKLVISSNTSFTVLSITDTAETGREPLQNGLYVDKEVNRCAVQIRDALFYETVGPIALFVDRTVKLIGGDIITDEVFLMYLYPPTNTVIFQRATKFTVLFNGEIVDLRGHCLFTDGYRTFSLGSALEFGKIQLNTHSLAPYILEPFVFDTDRFRKAITKLGPSPYLASTLGRLFVMQINDEYGENFFEQLRWFNDQSLVNIINATIEICDCSQIVALLHIIEKSDILANLRPLSKEALLRAADSYSLFKKIARFCNEVEKETYQDLLKELVRNKQFVNAAVLATAIGTDITELIGDVNMEYQDMYKNISENLEEQDAQDIRLLGTAFFSLGKSKEALACFASIDDKQKIEMLMIVDESLKAIYK